MNTVADILEYFEEKGVRISSVDGYLHYRTSNGALTAEDLEKLRTWKPQLLNVLRHAHQGRLSIPAIEPRSTDDVVPLTYAQQWWWDILDSRGNKKVSTRRCIIANRLRGSLNISHLSASVQTVTQRHESLRTRIITTDGIPTQLFDVICNLEVIDLTASREKDIYKEARHLVDEFSGQEIDLEIGPLAGAWLLKLNDNEFIFALAMSHVVSDGISLGILWTDIFSTYAELSLGLSPSLSKPAVQFGDYAVWQKKAEKWWNETNGAYWTERFSKAPKKKALRNIAKVELPIALGKDVSDSLKQLAKQEGTTLSLTMLTVYLATLSNWQQKNDLIVGLISNGRDRSALGDAVGCLAYTMYLRVRLDQNDTFRSFLKNVAREYFNASGHYDDGRMAAQYLDCIPFNWRPTQSMGEAWAALPINLANYLKEHLSIEPIPLDFRFDIDITWDNPGIMLMDSKNGILGGFLYRSDLYDETMMKELSRKIRFCAEMVTKAPDTSILACTSLNMT